MMTFIDFFIIYKLKNKATSNEKILQVSSSLSLNDVGIYLRDEPFEFDIGIVNLHASKGYHGVIYIHECYFDSNGCSPSQKLSNPTIKQNGHGLYSEHKSKV